MVKKIRWKDQLISGFKCWNRDGLVRECPRLVLVTLSFPKKEQKERWGFRAVPGRLDLNWWGKEGMSTQVA